MKIWELLFSTVAIIILLFFYFTDTVFSPESYKLCFSSPAKGCFFVELARTDAEKEKGLMFRESLDKNSGMLFVFEKEGIYPFWMKNTLIPLDIIWIDKDKKVVFISENNQPCLPAQAGKDFTCSLINPWVKAKYVLEVNAGVSRNAGLQIGNDAQF